MQNNPSPGTTNWTDSIPSEQWEVYLQVIRTARESSLPFAIGGAFSLAVYTGRWRNTKDFDFYVLPEDHDALIEIVRSIGMVDLHDQLPYDRDWIYRSIQNEVIVDIIWAMANDRARVDRDWLERGPVVEVRGELVRAVPAEELIWGKLFVMQKERSDWPDIFNLLYASGADLDWERLLERVGTDLPLLSAALGVFSWLSPDAAASFPGWLWDRLHLPPPQVDAPPESLRRRAHRLDIRPWFLPLLD